MEKTLCCGVVPAISDGHYCCTNCGHVSKQVLFTHVQSYNHFTWVQPNSYSRYRRCGNLLSKLCGRGPAINEEIIEHVKKQKPRNCKEIFTILQGMRAKLLPYEQASTLLWYSTGTRPVCLTQEERGVFLNQFKVIYDFWMKFKTTKFFPYFFLLRKFCQTKIIHEKLGVKRATLLRSYIRPLKCTERRKRYDHQYKHLVEKMTHRTNVEGDFSPLFTLPNRQSRKYKKKTQ